MKLKAEEVLALCRQIHSSLSGMVIDEARDEWRIYWISGLCMLRTVGQVLDKVDSKLDPALSEVISSHWKRLKAEKEKNWIFWEFIERERDNILKEFELGAAPEPLMLISTDQIDSGVAPDLAQFMNHWELFTSEGLSAIDAFEEAILFWSEYIGSIKRDYKSQR